MKTIRDLLENLEASSRRRLLFGLAGALVLVAVVVWGILPVYEDRNELQSRQNQTREFLNEVSRLKDEYEQAKRTAAAQGADQGTTAGFSLFSYVEEQAGRDGIQEHIAYMRPNTVESPGGSVERQVQIRLEEIRLEPFLTFLKHIEYGREPICVKRLTVRSPRDNPGRLRIDLLLSTFQ